MVPDIVDLLLTSVRRVCNHDVCVCGLGGHRLKHREDEGCVSEKYAEYDTLTGPLNMLGAQRPRIPLIKP